MVTQSESPRFNEKVFVEIYDCYRGIFGNDNVHCYLVHIPTYPTGMWSFSYSAKGTCSPSKVQDEAVALIPSFNLKYYNAQLHQAAFVLPNFVQEMIKPKS